MDVKPGSLLLAYVHPSTGVQHSFMTSLMSAVTYDGAHGRRMVPFGGPMGVRCGTGGVADARNVAAASALKGGAEWLAFVDTDMGFPANAFDVLVATAEQSGAGVAGALTFSLQLGDPDGLGGFDSHPAPVMFRWGVDDAGNRGVMPIADYGRDTVMPVAATGAACLVIHRRVLEKIHAESGESWFDESRYPDGRRVSEDLSFCFRAGIAGERIVVNTAVKTTHAKTVWVGEREWDEYLAVTS